MFAYFHTTLRWVEVAKRTIKEISDDNCLGLAAQLSFYFLLAVFPALLFFVALLGYLPIDNLMENVLAALGTLAPTELVRLLRGQLTAIAEGKHASLLTIGIVGAIWSSSAAMVAIIDALNRAYDVVEWRPWWKRRLLALVLTIALALFIIVSFVLVIVGPDVVATAAGWLDLTPVVATVWAILRWPVMVFGVLLGIDLVFHFAPNRPSRWVWITPGSLVAVLLWMVSSFAFKFYVSNFADYTATYGAIGGAIVAMLWFYVSSLAILIGAEVNGVLEHARRSPEYRL
jgi:membrane protein